MCRLPSRRLAISHTNTLAYLLTYAKTSAPGNLHATRTGMHFHTGQLECILPLNMCPLDMPPLTPFNCPPPNYGEPNSGYETPKQMTSMTLLRHLTPRHVPSDIAYGEFTQGRIPRICDGHCTAVAHICQTENLWTKLQRRTYMSPSSGVDVLARCNENQWMIANAMPPLWTEIIRGPRYWRSALVNK